ncbi:hypothetical protein C8R44DRAFT_749157 [Mycena epipterygia]|nr:hypothetical protein C8R44DRAFT_749157 [Mycena epipterygia]
MRRVCAQQPPQQREQPGVPRAASERPERRLAFRERREARRRTWGARVGLDQALGVVHEEREEAEITQMTAERFSSPDHTGVQLSAQDRLFATISSRKRCQNDPKVTVVVEESMNGTRGASNGSNENGEGFDTQIKRQGQAKRPGRINILKINEGVKKVDSKPPGLGGSIAKNCSK